MIRLVVFWLTYPATRYIVWLMTAESVPVPLAGVERFEASVDRVLEDGGMFSTVMCYDGPKKFLT